MPTLAPATFYGENRVTLEMIQRIRISRLINQTGVRHSYEKSRSSRSPLTRSRHSAVKLFPGISHGVKKPKPKKMNIIKKKPASQTKAVKTLSVREKMRNKFDFSRTPYALPAKKPRVALNEETGSKRKFFKTTVEDPNTKKTTPDNPINISEFDDINGVEEPFDKIKKNVSVLLHKIDWFDDDYMKPQVTRQDADNLSSTISTPTASYITLSNLTPEPITPETITPKPTQPVTPVTTKNNLNATPTCNVYATPLNVQIVPNTPVTSEGNNTSDVTPKSRTETSKLNKWFPLFSSLSSKAVLSDVTNKCRKRNDLLMKAAAPNDQYQIDAGQKAIGPRECVNCGMIYDIGDAQDVARHDHYHKTRTELKYKHTKNTNVVGYCGTDRIILIKYSDNKKRNKVLKILALTEDEIGSGYNFHQNSMAFIYVRNDNILGCVILEPNVLASRVLKNEGIMLLNEDYQRVKCGVNRIWVKPEFRGNKIATELMNCVRKNFIYGEYLNPDDIAFSITTTDGNEFAKKYCGRNDYLVYSNLSSQLDA